jgi:nucleoid DNA-binding protein
MSKRRLWVYMNSKLRGLIHSYATIAVLNILFEEMIADLKAGKTIEIFNFCTFNVKDWKPHKIFDIYNGIVKMTNGYRELKIKLNDDLEKVLIDNIDVKKTFNE